MRRLSAYLQRLRATLGINSAFFQMLEGALISLFFIQGLRFLLGIYYSRIASASFSAALIPSLPPDSLNQLSQQAGFVYPSAVTQEISLLGYMLSLPILMLLIGRFRIFTLFAAIGVAAARLLMIAQTDITSASASALVVGLGFVYITQVIRHRMNVLPTMFLIAFTTDQLIRAAGNTLDFTWSSTFFYVQLGLFFVAISLALGNHFSQQRQGRTNPTPNGLLTFWGGLSLGALLFLQLSLLSLPNAIAGRSQTSYASIVPILVSATFLPLFAPVRLLARQILGLFDSSVRGWIWLLLVWLFLILGTRFNGVVSLVGFVGAQFTVSLVWWWLVRPQATKEYNLSGVWVFLGILLFALLFGADVFTYEYAYVRSFAEPLSALNSVIVPLLRGLRGLGYTLILFAGLLVALPMIQSQRRIAWNSNTNSLQNGIVFVSIVGSTFLAAMLSAPLLISPDINLTSLRIATYNIHGGYSEFYAQSLEPIAQAIEQSGANVVLLQEVEAGRLTSFGVDQNLWLARRLGMDVRFYPTNEGLQGLAVLSRVPIVFADGTPLPSTGLQTGLQRVQVNPSGNQIVTIYNTWLELLLQTPDDAEKQVQEQAQQRQLDAAIRTISEHHPNRQLGLTVFGGTFNNIPDSPMIQSIDQRGFADPFAGSTIERSATLVRTGLSSRVDYIWLYPENIAEGVGVINSDASDHRLAFVSISLR